MDASENPQVYVLSTACWVLLVLLGCHVRGACDLSIR